MPAARRSHSRWFFSRTCLAQPWGSAPWQKPSAAAQRSPAARRTSPAFRRCRECPAPLPNVIPCKRPPVCRSPLPATSLSQLRSWTDPAAFDDRPSCVLQVALPLPSSRLPARVSVVLGPCGLLPARSLLEPRRSGPGLQPQEAEGDGRLTGSSQSSPC